MNGMLLFGIAHGVSDAAAGFAVGALLRAPGVEAGLLILLYNGLAFALQPVAGLMLDRLGQPKRGAVFGLLLTSAGLAVFWSNPRLGILLIGFGSAFFHAGGGAVSILNSPGKASGPGVFAAFGVIGLVIGARLSFMETGLITTFLVLVLVILAIAVMFIRPVAMKPAGNVELLPGFEIPAIIVLTAFALRSFVWTGVDRALDGSAYLALYVGFSAGVGKLAGGFLADRIGWLKWTILSLSGAALLLAFARDIVIPLLIGVFLLQSVTALTISWFGRALPGSPALAASLGLGAAVIAGGFPFAFSRGAWFGWPAILSALALSLAGYWSALRKKAEYSSG